MTSLKDAITQIALDILEAVRPEFGGENAADVVGEAASGDYTFSIDEAAESRLPEFVKRAGKDAGLRFAIYSEDRGLVMDAQGADYVLVIDPIDGTRPATCGFESCCISVAAARYTGDVATLGDVEAAVLVELKSGRILSADTETGLQLCDTSRRPIPIRGLSKRTEVQHLFWAHEICARPADATHAILSRLINDTSFGGGTFVFNSSSYAISRVVLGQLDAYIDPYAALLRGPAAEYWASHSRSLFKGKVFGLFPYDIAAALFLAKKAGAYITDARGNSLDSINLLDSSEASVLSCIVAANEELGRTLSQYVRQGLAVADRA